MKTRSSAKSEAAKELALMRRHEEMETLMHSPISSTNGRRKRRNLVATPDTGFKTEGQSHRNSVESMNMSMSSPCGPSPNCNRISTPHGFFNAKLVANSNGFSPNDCTDMSFVNDSFLFAVDKMEKHEALEKSTSMDDASFLKVLDKIENGKNCIEPDIFESSQELLDILPSSQFDNPVSSKNQNNVLSNKVVNQSTNNIVNLENSKAIGKNLPVQSISFKIPSNVDAKKCATKKTNKGRKKRRNNFKVAYTNRKAIKRLSQSGQTQLSTGDLVVMTEEEKLLLSSWGLPSQIVSKYKSKGVTSLFPWQLECLSNPKVLEGSNLLYSAPTSAGKTLVAEILMVKRVLELGKKAIMILPFVSVAREKMYSLQELFGDAGVRVEGFMGSYNPPGGFKAVDIAICTIEKANSLINRLLEESCLSDLGTIVVDEMHLIGDPGRGYLLEILLTKILFMTMKNQVENCSYSEDSEVKEKSKNLNIQLIGMSATLPNLGDLAKWLNAELVTTQYRPVPLAERIKIEGNIYDKDLQLVRTVKNEEMPVVIPDDVDDMVKLSLETILGGHSILIFCPTKAQCEANAVRIAKAFFNIGKPNSAVAPEIGEKLRLQLSGQKLGEVINQLQQCTAGLDEVLKQTVAYGVSYHHAGLTFDERDILESAFKRCVLRVIVATSTLSAGVNLPARRVLISTPRFNGSLLDPLTYCQMAGRAGRKGVDSEGESILLCPGDTKKDGIMLFQSQLNSVKSALLNQGGTLTSSLKRALLEVIASGVTKSPEEVRQYSKCTLLSLLAEAEANLNLELPSSQFSNGLCIEDCLKFLIDNEFVKLKQFESNKEDEFMPTNLGLACLASSLSPDEGIFVFKELQKAVRCFVLDNELHIIYQVTPTYLSEHMRNIDFTLFLRIWESLDENEKKVAELVGVSEAFIIRGMTGIVSRANSQQIQSFLIHQRFFAALALNDLVNEMSITDVSLKYNLAKGTIQNLQQAASTFAGMVTAFCGRLGWSNLELLLSQFQERLQFGTKRELCDLVRLSNVNGQKARVLYDAGIKSVVELAATEPAHVEHILHRAGPFQSNVHGDQTKRHWMMGKGEGLTEGEVAQMIVDEARQFLQIELGLPKHIEFGQIKPNRSYEDSNDSGNSFSNEENAHEQSSDSEKSETEKPMEEDRDSTFSESPTILKHSDDHVRPVATFDNDLADSMDSVFKNINSMPPSNEMKKAEKKKEEYDGKLTDIMESGPKCEVECSDQFLPVNVTKSENPKLETSCVQESKDIVAKEDLNESQEEMDIFENSANSPSILDENLNELSNVNFDEDFNSIASFMDVSLNISKNEPVTAKCEEVQPEEADSVKQLTESLTAGMLAIAEDTNFESEDMFADLEKEALDHVHETADLSTSNEIFDVSSELEDTSVATNTKRKSITCSSRLQQLRSVVTPRSSITLSKSRLLKDVPPEHLFSEKVGGDILKVVKISSPEYLPKSFFDSQNPIGIGIKTRSTKESSSTARTGIGSNIVRHQLNPEKSAEDNRKHAIALFNGSDTIWTMEWETATNGTMERSKLGRNDGKCKILDLFQKFKVENCSVIFMDAKTKLKLLVKTCGKVILQHFPLPNKVWDPKIAQWLWRFEDETWNITSEKLISMYLSYEDKKILTLKWAKEISDAFIAFKLMILLKAKLEDISLWNHFTDVEMPSAQFLMLMEMNGLQLDVMELGKLKRILQFKSSLLELRAFQLANRQFNLGSSKEISQILFHEIGLKQPKNCKGTGKDVLVKLDHDLPRVIMEWRKITSALQQVVIPFQQERNVKTGRVNGIYSHFTVTGRVVMSEPSIQCIPRDFDLQIDFDEREIEDIKNNSRIQFGNKMESLIRSIESGVKHISDMKNFSVSQALENNTISMRNAFVTCSEDFLLVSADYSQVELRILAHLCEDKNLIKVLNDKKADVFISLAAKWKRLPINEITSSMRQETKGLIYGIIYGMGAKTLSEQMGVSENEASLYISEFMRAYPAIRVFLDNTVKFCRETGYIETISGRKRYLPHINSRSSAERAQAERQAINSRIQGSAADIVKTAMTKIQSRFSKLFPGGMSPIDLQSSSRIVGKCQEIPGEIICFPILNLHDELMFEVRVSHVNQVAYEIRSVMESCFKLLVRLPVVVKSGKSWGKLNPYFSLE